jgi:uncharacterized membrane protein
VETLAAQVIEWHPAQTQPRKKKTRARRIAQVSLRTANHHNIGQRTLYRIS